MTQYRRLYIPGATYFFTVTPAQRGVEHLVSHVDDLRSAYAATRCEQPFQTDAIGILPDHLHAIWTLPPGDADFSGRWRKIKARFSRAVGGQHPRSLSKVRKRETGLWQRRFWEHAIRDADDYRKHLAYCLSNPVQHGLVARPVDWALSSIHRDVRLGHVDAQWCGSILEGWYGE